MWAELSYLASGVAMALWMALSKSPSDSLDPGQAVYRYQTSKVLSVGLVLGLAVLCSLLWKTASIPLDSLPGVLFFASGWLMLAMPAAIYLYCNAYRIIATDDALLIRGVGTHRSIPYRDIKEVVLKDGGPRSGSLLELYDARHRRLLSATSSFDYQGLSAVVRSRARPYGVVYRHRDMWGKWS